MADIFFSYARADQKLVASIVDLLETQGWSVWWDTRIGVGEQWDAVIEQEISRASCVVVVWSPFSVNSRWVRAEALEGLERQVLVPIVMGDAQPPLAFKLAQSINFSRWAAGESGDEPAKLLDAVRRVIGPLHVSVRPLAAESPTPLETSAPAATVSNIRSSAAHVLAAKLIVDHLAQKGLGSISPNKCRYCQILRELAESYASTTEMRPRWQIHFEEKFDNGVRIIGLTAASCNQELIGRSTSDRVALLLEFWRHRNMRQLLSEGHDSAESMSVDKEGSTFSPRTNHSMEDVIEKPTQSQGRGATRHAARRGRRSRDPS